MTSENLLEIWFKTHPFADTNLDSLKEILKFAQAEEREECAKIADSVFDKADYHEMGYQNGVCDAAHGIAKIIRNRGLK